MKNSNFLTTFCILTILILTNKSGSLKVKQVDPSAQDSTAQMNSLIKENIKLNRTVTKQLDKINFLNNTILNLNKENENLKINLSQTKNEVSSVQEKMKTLKKENEGQNNTNLVQTYSDIKTMLTQVSQFNMFLEQIKMQMCRRRELKKSFEEKVKAITESQNKVLDMHKEVETLLKDNLAEISGKVTNIERFNFEMKEKLFGIEKEKTEEDIKKREIISGSDEFLSSALETECVGRNSCNVCLEDIKCVWCSMEKRCTSGSVLGPSDGSCSTSFQYGTCSEFV